MKNVCGLLVLLVCSSAFAKNTHVIYRNGTPMQLHVTEVRSIAPEQKVGFSKSLETYAVDAYSTVSIGSWTSGPQMQYVLYCANSAPTAGNVYDARDEDVDRSYSFLHLWPVEKDSLGIKKRGRLYRVIVMKNVNSGRYPDLACDVYSARDAQPQGAQ